MSLAVQNVLLLNCSLSPFVCFLLLPPVLLERMFSSRKSWRLPWRVPKHSFWASHVEEIEKGGKVVPSSSFSVQMRLTCNFLSVCDQSTHIFWVFIIGSAMLEIMLKATEEFWDQSTPQRLYNLKGGIRNVYGEKTVVSRGLKNMCQIMSLKCRCWKNSESERWLQAAATRKGPPEQVGSELDSETRVGFGQAERKDTGVPGGDKDVSAGISSHEGKWLTLGTCLKIYNGRIKLAFHHRDYRNSKKMPTASYCSRIGLSTRDHVSTGHGPI